MKTGSITLWYGQKADIPDGWQLCDGTNGTPNLCDKFVVGAGHSYDPDDEGGNVNHDHDFTSSSHHHELSSSHSCGLGAYQYKISSLETSDEVVTGTTDETNGLPPYMALFYIIKIS